MDIIGYVLAALGAVTVLNKLRVVFFKRRINIRALMRQIDRLIDKEQFARAAKLGAFLGGQPLGKGTLLA